MDTVAPQRKVFRPIRRFLGRGIHFVYRRCINPLSEDEDSKRKEFILNIILLLFIPFLLLLDLFVLIATIREGSHYSGVSFLALSFIVLILICLLLLSRRGQARLSVWILIGVLFLATSYGAMQWGVELPMVAISYVLIIVVSSILISTRFGLLITSIIAITIISIAELQITGRLNPSLEWKHATVRINDPIQLTIAFLVITGLSWLSNTEIERSLRRARVSEALLRQERDQLEITVQERTKEVREMQKDKITQLYRFAEFGRLSSGVFHDLMNSLNNVALHVSQLPKSSDAIPEAQDYLDKAIIASKRMSNYIQKIRKQMAAEDVITTFSVEEEILNAVDILKFKARETNVAVSTVIKQSPLLRGNAMRLYQVIVNLLGNAIEACEGDKKSGKIIITLRVDKRAQAIILSVADNGYGIPKDIQQAIFMPFFSTKSYQKGIGLGLSQTKEIVEKDFSGTINVTSSKKRTEFIITLPLNNAHTRNHSEHY